MPEQVANKWYAPETNGLNMKVADAVKTILNEVNGGNRKQIIDSIRHAVRYDHRTLQQAFWSVMLMAQIAYADSDFDLRNEQSVQLAKAVKELAEKLNMDMGLMYV